MDADGRTALIAALQVKHPRVAERTALPLLADPRTAVNVRRNTAPGRDDSHLTALHWAAKRGLPCRTEVGVWQKGFGPYHREAPSS